MRSAVQKIRRDRIKPSRALYIKLGRQGIWEKECIAKGELRFGYDEIRHELCVKGKWDELHEDFRKISDDPGARTRHKSQVVEFYEAAPDVLWFTFFNNRLYWCFTEGGVVVTDGKKIRRTRDGWHCKDILEQELTWSILSGQLLKTIGFRGTVCSIDKAVEKYLIARINGETPAHIQTAIDASNTLKKALTELIRALTWKDFELFVDLIFRQAGWQRTSDLGKNQKAMDLEIQSPVTNERAMVQVKSSSNAKEFRECVAAFEAMSEDINRMFFIVHSTHRSIFEGEFSESEMIQVYDSEELAELALNSGLTQWLIKKAG